MLESELIDFIRRWVARRSLATLLVVAVWAVTWLAPRWAFAQSEADRATARNLAAEGYTALKTQDYATAEDRFRRADALVHAPTLVVDHARALIGLGRIVEAQERLELVAREGVSDNAPWVWKKAYQDAEQLVNEVKPKVAWLTINVTGPAEPRVMVDERQVPVAALGVRRAVDPGPRRISASASGYVAQEIAVTMPEGGERAVTLDLAMDPGVAAVPAPIEKPAPPPPTPAPEKKSSNALAYAALGLGGAGLVVGTVMGVLSLGKRSELMERCENSTVCRFDPDGPSRAADFQLADDYRRYGTISGISLGVGLASTGAGVWMLIANRRSETPSQPPPRASVVPYVSIGDVGLRGAF